MNSARSKARDAKRISDIRQIETALALYRNDNGSCYILVSTFENQSNLTLNDSRQSTNPACNYVNFGNLGYVVTKD